MPQMNPAPMAGSEPANLGPAPNGAGPVDPMAAQMPPDAPAGQNPVIEALKVIGMFAMNQREQGNPAVAQALEGLLQAMQGSPSPEEAPQAQAPGMPPPPAGPQAVPAGAPPAGAQRMSPTPVL